MKIFVNILGTIWVLSFDCCVMGLVVFAIHGSMPHSILSIIVAVSGSIAFSGMLIVLSLKLLSIIWDW